MRKFTFRLAAVSRIRKLEERVAKENVLIAIKASDDAKAALDRFSEDLLKLDYSSNVVHVRELQSVQVQRELQEQIIEIATKTVQEKEQIVYQERQQWKEAAKKAAIIDKLDDRARLIWMMQFLREESKELDELGSVAFINRNRGNRCTL
jgi:flagellar export protein FliJ